MRLLIATALIHRVEQIRYTHATRAVDAPFGTQRGAALGATVVRLSLLFLRTRF